MIISFFAFSNINKIKIPNQNIFWLINHWFNLFKIWFFPNFVNFPFFNFFFLFVFFSVIELYYIILVHKIQIYQKYVFADKYVCFKEYYLKISLSIFKHILQKILHFVCFLWMFSYLCIYIFILYLWISSLQIHLFFCF